MVTDPALVGLSCLHKGHKYNFLCITFLQLCTSPLLAQILFLKLVCFIRSIKFELSLKNQIYIIFSEHLIKAFLCHC